MERAWQGLVAFVLFLIVSKVVKAADEMYQQMNNVTTQ